MTKELEKIYNATSEDQPQAPEELREAYDALHDAFEDYLCELEKHMWAYGYQCGLRAER